MLTLTKTDRKKKTFNMDIDIMKNHCSISLAEIIKVCHFEMFAKLTTPIHKKLFKMRCILLLKMIGGTSVDVNVDIR